jgi:hypothetical protein
MPIVTLLGAFVEPLIQPARPGDAAGRANLGLGRLTS